MNYQAPTTIQGAVSLLSGATGRTRILAGGTDFIVQLNADQMKSNGMSSDKAPDHAAEGRTANPDNLGGRQSAKELSPSKNNAGSKRKTVGDAVQMV